MGEPALATSNQVPDHIESPIRVREFKFYLGFRFFLTLALQMQGVVVGWQVYEITREPLSLGLVGLAEAISYIGTSLFGGYVADNYRALVASLDLTEAELVTCAENAVRASFLPATAKTALLTRVRAAAAHR